MNYPFYTACAFLLLISETFWLIPYFRRSKSATITALKIVPAVCACMAFSVPVLWTLCKLILSPLPANFKLPYFVSFAETPILVLLAGLWTIVHLVRKIRPRPSVKNAALWASCSAIFVLSGIIRVSTIAGCAFLLEKYSALKSWRTAPITSATLQTGLSLESRQTHPFLAEYDYRLSFKSGRKAGLFNNTGGRTHFKIFSLRGGGLLLADLHDESSRNFYIVYPERETAFLLKYGRLYSLPEKLLRGFGSSPTDEYRKIFLYLYENSLDDPVQSIEVEGVPMYEQTAGADFLGEIRGGNFVPCEKSSESHPILDIAKIANISAN